MAVQINMPGPNKKCAGIASKSPSVFLQCHRLQSELELQFVNHSFSWKHKWGCGRFHIHLHLFTIISCTPVPYIDGEGSHYYTSLILVKPIIWKAKACIYKYLAQTLCRSVYLWLDVGFWTLGESPFEGLCLSLLNAGSQQHQGCKRNTSVRSQTRVLDPCVTEVFFLWPLRPEIHSGSNGPGLAITTRRCRYRREGMP